ncbi:MAG: DEAD/DEAH box helicase [Candidatus Micrarchaeaceae archaeon]|jgi:ATP-dependent helicase Lhr and Lhr-like helicase
MSDLYKLFLERHGSFTDIQKLSIPIIENGENCLVVAPTGSGKTEAVVLPLLESLGKNDNSAIKILYITPLRALNRDMMKRLEELCKHTNVTIGVRHGDTTQKEKSRQTRVAPMFLITTPETLQSILPTKYIGTYLKNLKAVVIDELHELYYNKRGAQLSIALERLEELAPNFQRIGISATIGDPELVKNFLCNDRKCRIVKVENIKEMELSVQSPKKPRQKMEELEDKFGLDGAAIARLEKISELVSNSNSSIIFANTRQVVESLGSRLVYMNSRSSFGGIGVHHSSLDKQERINIENNFKNGTIKSIIATSSLELGIDIGSVDLVIQYGSPRQSLRLAQRVGRSGHTHRGVSRGVIITTNSVETLEALAITELVRNGSFEIFRPQFGALDVLTNQICGIVLDKSKLELKKMHEIISRSYLYKDLKIEELTNLLNFMLKLRLLGFDGNIITGGSRTRMYYYAHLSVIPDSKRFLVKNISENRIISTLDEKFVANNVDENSVFITKGLPWKVISIDKDVISVEPSTDLEAAVPDWTGEDIPVSHKTVQSAFLLLDKFSGKEHYKNLTDDSFRAIKELKEKQEVSFMPSAQSLIIERLEDHSIIYTGLGTQANEALSRLLANIISLRLGRSVNVRASPYLILIGVKKDMDLSRILMGINSSSLQNTLKGMVGETELFRYKFITIAKLFGVIDKDAAVSRSFAKRIIKVMRDSPIYEETLRELIESYFDISTLASFFDKIHKGTVKIKVIDAPSPSMLTKTILSSAYYTKELITPLTPNNELVESFSRFIMSKVAKFLCTYCGFVFSRKLSEVNGMDKIMCPSCSSSMITFYTDDYNKVIRKRLEDKKLDHRDKLLVKEMLQYASLLDSYGAKAAIALSVYGIGPKSAARALMMLRHDERAFFIDLIEAQKNFVRTKKYWSV